MNTYRARGFPFWLRVGFGAPMLLMAVVVALMPVLDAETTSPPGLALLGALAIALPAQFLIKVGIDIRRTRIVLTDERLKFCLSFTLR